MNQVLGVLQELNVRWKKIGHYNMKCLWLHVIQDSESLDANHVADTGTTTMNANTLPTQTTVKFEMQVLYPPLFPFQDPCKNCDYYLKPKITEYYGF